VSEIGRFGCLHRGQRMESEVREKGPLRGKGPCDWTMYLENKGWSIWQLPFINIQLRLARRKGAGWSLKWPSGANLVVHMRRKCAIFVSP